MLYNFSNWRVLVQKMNKLPKIINKIMTNVYVERLIKAAVLPGSLRLLLVMFGL